MDYTKTKISFFIFLAVVTVFCHTFVEQFTIIGPEMLTNNWKLQSFKNSKGKIEGKTLYLSSSDYNNNIIIQQYIQNFTRGSILRLSADMKCQNVQPGKRARLILMQYNGDGDGLNLSHLVVSFAGTREWQRYSNFFTISPETKKIRVAAQLSKCTGVLWLKNLHLYPVAQTESYSWVKIIILTAWGIYFLFLLGTCFFNGKNNIAIRMMLVIVFILIIIGISMPVDMKMQISAWCNDQFSLLGVVSGSDMNWDMSKAGHFFFFLILGLVLSFLLKHESDLVFINNILLLAGGTEIAQLFISGRGPLFRDFFIDVNGGLIAFIVMKVFFAIRTDK